MPVKNRKSRASLLPVIPSPVTPVVPESREVREHTAKVLADNWKILVTARGSVFGNILGVVLDNGKITRGGIRTASKFGIKPKHLRAALVRGTILSELASALTLHRDRYVKVADKQIAAGRWQQKAKDTRLALYASFEKTGADMVAMILTALDSCMAKQTTSVDGVNINIVDIVRDVCYANITNLELSRKLDKGLLSDSLTMEELLA